MPKIEPFERYAERYERWFDQNPHVFMKEVAALKTLLPSGGCGLEIGVGTGRFAAALGIKMGLEPSGKMGAVARQRGISVTEGVAKHLPFGDNAFDFVLMVTTVCFLDDVLASFKECRRVLRPGGALVIGFVNRQSRLGAEYQKRKSENVFYKPATFFSAPEISEIMLQAGFGKLRYAQTLCGGPSRIAEPERVREGYAKGGFVVIRAERPVD